MGFIYLITVINKLLFSEKGVQIVYIVNMNKICV